MALSKEEWKVLESLSYEVLSRKLQLFREELLSCLKNPAEYHRSLESRQRIKAITRVFCEHAAPGQQSLQEVTQEQLAIFWKGFWEDPEIRNSALSFAKSVLTKPKNLQKNKLQIKK